MRRLSLLVAVGLIVALAGGRPVAQTSTWRPVILSDNGMVASGHALASEAGLRVLKSGGNDVDAAVAAWAVQGLVEPRGLGEGDPRAPGDRRADGRRLADAGQLRDGRPTPQLT
jgi:gamma-glutamyltranspeptidase/glutathione hydrolase